MPRRRRFRRVWAEPGFTAFGPAGVVAPEEVILTVGELEAIRLKDLSGLEQEQAANLMGISQPTFNRILLAARKKIADAIVNGKAIRIEGGVYKMVGRPGFRRRAGGPPVSCTCPVCGYTQPKIAGVPCAQLRCAKCGGLMTRG